MLSYRYVLHLRENGDEQIVRHTSFRPLRPGETLPVASRGRWVIREIVSSDDQHATDGIVYCEPADDRAQRSNSFSRFVPKRLSRSVQPQVERETSVHG